MTRQFSKILLALLAAMALAAASVAQAQPLRYQPGVHYEVINDSAIPAGQRRVTEFFWYGCPSCYAFEPLLESWQARQAAGVVLERTPGIWNDTMLTHAKIYYAARETGVLDKVHGLIFDEIHQRGNVLLEEEQILAFFAAQGVDGPSFARTLASFTVDAGARKAQRAQRDYGIPSVPSMVINGKYRVSVNSAVPTYEKVLEVVDFLLALQ